WQISDMRSKVFLTPLLERGAVQTDLSANRQPHPDKPARERRLARSAWSNDAQCLARLEFEAHVLNDEPWLTWRRNVEAFDRQILRWRRQGRPGRRVLLQELQQIH